MQLKKLHATRRLLVNAKAFDTIVGDWCQLTAHVLFFHLNENELYHWKEMHLPEYFREMPQCIPLRIEVIFGELLHNHQLLNMLIKVVMKNAPHWTIGKSKGRSMLYSECCGDWILKLSLPLCSQSYLMGPGTRILRLVTSSLSECCDQCNNRFLVCVKARWGYNVAILESRLRKVVFNSMVTDRDHLTHQMRPFLPQYNL